MRFRFALLQITWERPDPEPKKPTIEASGGHNFERSGPQSIGFAQPEPEDKKR